MTEDISSVGRHFDYLAPEYDANATARGWRSNAVLGEMLGDLGCAPRSVLDLGAGTGATVSEVLAHTNPVRVVAVDASGGMVDYMQERFAGDTRIECVRAPVAEYLESTDESFDLVTAVSVLPFNSEVQTFIDGMAGHVNPGGNCIFTYEPVNPMHPLQSERETTLRNETVGTAATIHRQHPNEIAAAVLRAEMQLVDNRLFLPLPGSDPVLLAGIVVARNPHED